MRPDEQLAAVLDEFVRLASEVRDDQWDAPTPSTEWTVRDLVNHVQVGNQLFAAIVGGQAPELGRIGRLPETDRLGDDPAAAVRDTGAAMVAAFARPGALERIVTVPIGSLPGIAALHLRVVELIVHGWDLAMATGQQPRFPADLVEQALAFTVSKLGDVPGDRSPARSVADGAPAIDQLVACLGRRVTT